VRAKPTNTDPMTQELLVPLNRLLEIARQAVKKHCDESHCDFEDFVQDVLLGILQRQGEYIPTLGTAETFIRTVANQKACNRIREQRRREKIIGTNRTGCIPFRNSPEDANELDTNGNLPCIDESIQFARFFSMLDVTDSAVLKLQLAGYSAGEITNKLGISMNTFRRVKKKLSEKIEDFRFFKIITR
jgi:RNA polymerase sigma factor (sigma-70 family)